MKVEFYDGEGVRHSIAIDGPVTREKVTKILDLVEVMSGTPQATALGLSPRKFDRLASTVLSRLRGKDFSSSDAKKSFETTFGERIPLSTVSTYLSRLADRGVLEREEKGVLMRYRVRPEEQSPSLALRTSTQP
ncbi:MAG TPA: hypothetical protein VIH83_06450 [Candidatus Bathyarchaeia archaeon]